MSNIDIYGRDIRVPSYQKPAGKIIIVPTPNAPEKDTLDIGKFLLTVSVNYSMTLASQLQFSVIDKDLIFTKNNTFEIGRTVVYETQTMSDLVGESGKPVKQLQLFEIANVTISNGSGSSPVVQVTCYSKAIQQMKRDRKPKAISGSGSEYVRRAAAKYGLKYYGEYTSKSHKFATAQSGKLSESVWDVISGIASEAQFVVFEVDGYLIFASQKFLLKKWGIVPTPRLIKDKNKQTKEVKDWHIPLAYDQKPETSLYRRSQSLQLLQYPTLTLSDNSPFDGEGSAVINREYAVQMRPGMTIKLNNFGAFDGYYLITSVSFPDLSPDPVNIEFRKPEKQKETEIKQIPVGKRFKQTGESTAALRDITQAANKSSQKTGKRSGGRKP